MSGGVVTQSVTLVRKDWLRKASRGVPWYIYVASAFLLFVILASLLAPIVAPYPPNAQDLSAGNRNSLPSPAHWLGTDKFGRDTLSRILWGFQPSLEISLVSVGAAALIGCSLGIYSGYRGGRVDSVVNRFVDALQSFPALLVAIGVVAISGPGVGNLMIAIGFAFLAVFIRLSRNATLSIRESPYIEAVQSVGASTRRITWKYLWPNIRPAIFTMGILLIAEAMIVEATLSFLGIGLQPPTASLGNMIREAFNELQTASFLLIVVSGVLFVIVLCLNLIGDYLGDRFDRR